MASRPGNFVLGASALLCLLVAAAPLRSQSPAPSTHSQAAKPAHHRAAHKAKPAPAAPQEELPPPEPPKPDWPALAEAHPAEVQFDGSALTVRAANSSLKQILDSIATATGLKIEGFSTDQRVFGNYGPAPARAILSQLLQGSGYNILMVGEQGSGTPRQLVLTTTGGAAAAPAQSAQTQNVEGGDDEVIVDNEPVDQPQPQPQPGFPGNPGAPGRTPQQMMQEMQMRQQQIQQQQQQMQPPQLQPPPQ